MTDAATLVHRTGPGTAEAPRRDIIVIGASAGGVAALSQLVEKLPVDLPAAVFVVLHTAPGMDLLAPLLDRAGPLPAEFAEDGESIRNGRIYVAPSDRHLILRDNHLHLTRTPRENWTRPAVNPLFRSAASACGTRVVGVVLTGMLDNGTAGLLAVEAAGGVIVVQDPEDAAFPDMPRSALDYIEVDHLVALDALPALLVRLAGSPAPSAGPIQQQPAQQPVAGTTPGNPHPTLPHNASSGFTCPECNGALWQLRQHDFDEYICRIGHRFSPGTLLEAQGVARDVQLEASLRSLREEIELAERLLQRGRERGVAARQVEHAARRVDKLQRLADELEQLIRDPGLPAVDTV